MQRLILKFLYLVAIIRYPNYRGDAGYLVRDNWFARLAQLRFWWADYVSKKPYKVIEFQGEFDQELRYALPFAYWHQQNGTLKNTVASKNTAPFYFFNPNHEERFDKRVWQTNYGNYIIPNMPHSPAFDGSKWMAPPFKAQYQNTRFVFAKPLLVIANKYNIEWDKPPINFLSIDALNELITNLKSRYQIIYNRPLGGQIVLDNSEIMDLGEHAWLRANHPEVLQMNDLYEQHRAEVANYNHLQLLVYANADRFISMHGGTAALASYFGGINVILSHPGGGWEHVFNEYETLFPRFSGAKILHAKSVGEVFEFVKEYF